MPITGSRTRRRSTIIPKSGPIKLGYFNSWTTGVSGGVPFARWGTAQNPVSFYTYPLIRQMSEFVLDELHDGPPYKSGGPFKSLKVTCSDPYGGVYGSGVYTRLDGLQRYVGGFRAAENGQFGADVVMNDLDILESSLHFPSMTGLGDKAWQRAKPKLEKAGLGVMLAELRDAPRMMKTTASGFHETWKALGGNQASRRMQPDKAADHFLNLQFGWKPFLKDLSDLNKVTRDSAALIDKLRDQNGRYVRRRITLVDETTTNVLSEGVGCLLYPNSTFNQTGSLKWFTSSNPATWQLSEEVQNLVTCSGKFRFYRPEFDPDIADHFPAWAAVQANMTLLGLRISPSNIYKATPWSWAIDWFSNVGDYVDHANDVLIDSIVCKYLFVMQHKIRKQTFIQKLPFSTGTVTLEFSRLIESKERQAAGSPYGFNLTWDQMTPRQMAIAVALGLSKKPPLSGAPG